MLLQNESEKGVMRITKDMRSYFHSHGSTNDIVHSGRVCDASYARYTSYNVQKLRFMLEIAPIPPLCFPTLPHRQNLSEAHTKSSATPLALDDLSGSRIVAPASKNPNIHLISLLPQRIRLSAQERPSFSSAASYIHRGRLDRGRLLRCVGGP